MCVFEKYFSKIFVPTKLFNAISATTNAPEYETVSTSKRKIEAWLMATGMKSFAFAFFFIYYFNYDYIYLFSIYI